MLDPPCPAPLGAPVRDVDQGSIEMFKKRSEV